MDTKTIRSREDYLTAAVEEMRPLFARVDREVPLIRVSTGFPSRGALSNAKRVIGQCWASEASADGAHQIFISPVLEETDIVSPQGVLATLVHEVGHAVVGVAAKHGSKFRKVAEGVGLTGKMTATIAGPELLEDLQKIYAKLGAFPHVKLNPLLSGIKKQGTRLIKCECGDCGYVVRTTKKWIQIGAPHCPSHGAMNFDEPED